MALFIYTSKASQLQCNVRDLIISGRVSGWEIDSDGDFYRTSPEIKAWMRPTIEDKRLVFGIIGKKEENMTKRTYSMNNIMLAELFLLYFDEDIEKIEITSLLSSTYDVYGG